MARERPIIGVEARCTARALVSVLPAGRCRPPVSLFEELSRRPGVRGACLLESSAQGRKSGTRTLALPEGAIRLQVRGDEVSFRALTPDGELLLQALPRFGRFEATDPALTDEERLRSPSVLDAVRALGGLVQDEDGGAGIAPGVYGAFSYELVDRWEDLPPRPPDPWREPDIDVVLGLDAVLYDHLASEVQVITRWLSPSGEPAAEKRHKSYLRALRKSARPEESRGSPAPEKRAEPDVSDEEFLAAVRKFLHHIDRGDVFQAVLSRGLSVRSGVDSLAVYRELRRENPSPYMFHLDLGEGVLFGASPETCIKVEGATLEIRPIAGTAPRGFAADGTIDPELDSRLAVGLLLDPKEQAEHAMLLDLARNDVARVSVPGTRRVEAPFAIEKYSHVQHLVSAVVGELRPGLDALHAYRAAANMGTLTGAPKLRAMELIRETEPRPRGFYGGAVGYLLADGPHPFGQEHPAAVSRRSVPLSPRGGLTSPSAVARPLSGTPSATKFSRRRV